MSFKLVYLIPFVAAGAGLVYNHFEARTSIVTETSKISAAGETESVSQITMTEVKVSDKAGEYIYQLDEQRITLDVTETSFLTNMRGTQGGMTAQMGYFEDKATRKFEQKFKNASHCPASFFNRYSKRKTFIATSPLVKAKLKGWENVTWKNTDEWFKTKLRGRCITGANSYVIDGQEMVSRLPNRVLSKCKYFYVEKVLSRTPYLDSEKTL